MRYSTFYKKPFLSTVTRVCFLEEGVAICHQSVDKWNLTRVRWYSWRPLQKFSLSFLFEEKGSLSFFYILAHLQQSLICMLFKKVNLNWQIISSVCIGLDKSISVFSCLQLSSLGIIPEIHFILSSESQFFLSTYNIKLYLYNCNID